MCECMCVCVCVCVRVCVNSFQINWLDTLLSHVTAKRTSKKLPLRPEKNTAEIFPTSIYATARNKYLLMIFYCIPFILYTFLSPHSFPCTSPTSSVWTSLYRIWSPTKKNWCMLSHSLLVSALAWVTQHCAGCPAHHYVCSSVFFQQASAAALHPPPSCPCLLYTSDAADES